MDMLKDGHGVVKARQPNENYYPEAAIAWSKIRAVYGPFPDGTTFNKLAYKSSMIHRLGTTKVINKQKVRSKQNMAITFFPTNVTQSTMKSKGPKANILLQC